ncbi:MAG: alpha/beta hydrolase [Candidatus Omnitrophica bacterium]|nr:alpha/beta hydrolase [Candidatus Omnitrophota bacterium]
MPRVKLGDISLYYEEQGKGQPLLLIAGLGADHASWTGVSLRLARHFRVITFDNRGSGRSDTPRTRYSVRCMAGDAVKLLDYLRIQKCHVIGHSMGGYIAGTLAAHYPERVGMLVLEATAPVSTARNNFLFDDFLNRFKRGHDSEALMRSWSYWSFSPKTFERKGFVATFIKKASTYPYPQSAEGFKRQIGAVKAFDGRGSIKNIKARTLVIMGADDILIYPAESMALVDNIPDSIGKEIKHAGHCVHVEMPAVFTETVERFLTGFHPLR